MTIDPEPGRLTPDRDLVVRIAVGDGNALAELRRRHDGTLYALAYAVLGDSGDATHVVSEAFLEAIRVATTFDAEQDHVPSWLSGILRQRAHEVLQRRTPALGIAAMQP
jgi:DNA-directed RNA polymerase specialized sigma24 family protein